MILLKSCPKKYTKDLDKALSPKETIHKVKKVLKEKGIEVLEKTQRIDIDRLGIPVFMSICGPAARKLLPGRKQMGKGSSEEQAEASALMELIERFSLFYFWNENRNFITLSWEEAEKKFKNNLISWEEIPKSTGENLSLDHVKKLMNLVNWKFCKTLIVGENKEIFLPVDWFRKLNEFNGSSSGNTYEESILQGSCELVERHVCAIIDREKPILPTLDPKSFKDPTLKRLWNCFKKESIEIWLKDFSLDTGIPTVGALAYDPSTFPQKSEIVFTAGTATSPEKAAIRALTEVAQLAGDFCTNSNYEASGLSKYNDLKDCQWIKQGPEISIESMPDISHDDIYEELKNLIKILNNKGYRLYSVDTTHPDINIPCNYNIIPGFLFRERTLYATVGMFVGRIIAEELPVSEAEKKLQVVEEIYKDLYFIPFLKGLVHLRKGDIERAVCFFKDAKKASPSKEETSLILFYIGYAYTRINNWTEAMDYLDESILYSPDSYANYNLKGVCLFKLKRFEDAIACFKKALAIDKGSAIDYANIGICYKSLNKMEAAKQYLNISLELEPGLEFARQNLNEILNKNSLLKK